MTNKQKLLTAGLAAAGITTFGLVVGLASQANYNGQNPRARVNAEISQIKSVAFKNEFAPFTSDYSTLKNKLFDQDGKLKADSNLLDDLQFISTNNDVYSVPNGIKVEIEKFEAQDSQSRFELQFHLSQTINNKVAKSDSYTVYLSQSDAVKNALIQYSDFVRNSLSTIKPIDLSYSKDSKITANNEQMAKPLSLTQVSDFVSELNESANSNEVLAKLSSHLNFNQILNDINDKATTLSGELGEKPFTIKLVQNPTNNNEKQWASLSKDNSNAFDFWVETSFSPETQTRIASSASKSDTIIQKIEVGQNANFFLDPQKVINEIGIFELSSLDFYRDPNSSDERKDIYFEPLNKDGIQKTISSNFDTSKVDSYKYDAFTFFNELQKISNQDDINKAINRLLIKGVRLNLGEYQDLPAELVKKYFRYDFLTKKASIKIGVDNRLYIDLPARISLLDSVVGGDGSKAIASKEVKFDLDNFKKVDQNQLDSLISENKTGELGGDTAKPLTTSQLISSEEISSLIKNQKLNELAQLISSSNGYNFNLNNKMLEIASADAQVPTISDIEAAHWTKNLEQSYQDQNIFSSKSNVFKSQDELGAFYHSLLTQGHSAVVNGLYKLAKAVGVSFDKGKYANLDDLGSLSLSDLDNIKIQNNNSNSDDSDDNNFLYLFDINGYFTDYANSYPLYLPSNFKQLSPDFSNYISNLKPYDSLTFSDLENSDKNYNFRLLSFLSAYQFKRAQLLDASKLIEKPTVSPSTQGASVPGTGSIVGGAPTTDDTYEYDFNDYLSQVLGWKIDWKSSSDTSTDEAPTPGDLGNAISFGTGPAIENNVGQSSFIPHNFPFNPTKSFDANKIYSEVEKNSDTSNPGKHKINYFGLEQMSSLKDLVVAFYLQAAANGGWSNKSDFGFKVSVAFEETPIEDKSNKVVSATTNTDKKVIELKYWYKLGFKKSNGDFVDDVLHTKKVSLYLQTSSFDGDKFKAISNLDSTILAIPTQYTSLIFGKNKFKLLKDTIEERNKEVEAAKPQQTQQGKPGQATTPTFDPKEKFENFKVLTEGLIPYLKSINNGYDFEIDSATLNSDTSATLKGKVYVSITEPVAPSTDSAAQNSGAQNNPAQSNGSAQQGTTPTTKTTKVTSSIPLVIKIVENPNKDESTDGLFDKLWKDEIVVAKAKS